MENDGSVIGFLNECETFFDFRQVHKIAVGLEVAFSDAAVITVFFADIGEFDDAAEIDVFADGFFADVVGFSEEFLLKSASGSEMFFEVGRVHGR